MPVFEQYIGIDYSGRQTASTPLRAHAVYKASANGDVVRQQDPTLSGTSKSWTRTGVFEYLLEQVDQSSCIIGIDHGLSMPYEYFQRYQLTSWDQFLEDFVSHWPTDQPRTTVRDVRQHKPDRTGNSTEYRICELWTPGAKSVFQFDVQGQVATSTHAGLPWLKRLREHTKGQLHFWPFDGWEFPEKKSVVAEVFPTLWRKRFERSNRTADEQDAYAVSRWLKTIDQHNAWKTYQHPLLTAEQQSIASLEGWILGVV